MSIDPRRKVLLNEEEEVASSCKFATRREAELRVSRERLRLRLGLRLGLPSCMEKKAESSVLVVRSGWMDGWTEVMGDVQQRMVSEFHASHECDSAVPCRAVL
jgi:hypothetical protein